MRTHRRGIVLIGILVLTLLTTLFIGALLQMNPTRLRQTLQEERHDLAAAAAQAGKEYALQRLTVDPTWKGQASALTVQTEHMVVREDRGNVFGWIRGDKSEWAGFRIRFNYQDGNGGKDGLDEPAHPIASRGISLNNLGGASATQIPLGTGPDGRYEGTDGFLVPERSVALIVEGMVGPNIAPDAIANNSPQGLEVTTRTLEGIYQISGYSDVSNDGSVFMAGGDSRFLLGDAPNGTEVNRGEEEIRGLLRLMATDQVASMRTKGSSSLRVAPGKRSPYNFYPDMDAEVRVGKTSGFSPTTKAGQQYTLETEAPTDALIEIAWEKVAASDQPDRLQLPAGVYTVSEGTSDSNDKNRIKYYPMTFQEYRETLIAKETPVAATVPADFLSRVQLNGKDWTNPEGGVEKRDLITFEKDVEVTAVGNNTDLAIVPAGGAKQKAVADLSSVISPSHFNDLNETEKNATDLAALKFLTKDGTGGPYNFQIEGQTVTYNPIAQLGDQVTGLSSAGQLTATILKHGSITIPPNAGLDDAPGVQPVNATTSPGPTSGPVRFSNPTALLAKVNDQTPLTIGIIEKNIDPLEVPGAVLSDDTSPQDLEISFAPIDGQSAAIRTPGSVILGSHLSGKGGAIVAGGNINIVGLSVDLDVRDGERDGLSLFAENNINVSTYDKKRNKYWDASIKGVIFARGDLTLRLGEATDKNQKEPSWGNFDFLGTMIALGTAPAYTVPVKTPNPNSQTEILDGIPSNPLTATPDVGNASLIARGMRLFYEPKFLDPYLSDGPKRPIFTAVSVVEN